MADLNPDEEMMVAAASYPLRGAGHHNIQCAGRKFSHTRQAGGNFPKRIDRRSGDPNI
jgi:hypothetical protein